MHLFIEQINDFDDWFGKVFQSIPAFMQLIEHIFWKENLPLATIENMPPGTNAVFKVGNYVIKIFVPPIISEKDIDFGTSVDVELFGIKWANARGVPSPKLIVEGAVEDKYFFRYMIMEYLHGTMLNDIESHLTYEDKVIIGQNMRKITDKLNAPCENFTPFDVLQHALDNDNWCDEGFPATLEAERLEYLAGLTINENDKVYCHGDLHGGNVLVDDKRNVYIVDFADAMYAPKEYEQLYIVSSLFCFEKPYMLGYFGDYAVEDIVDLCMTWLPIHAWGHSATEGNLKPAKEITSFAVMRERLYNLITSCLNR